MSYEQAKEDHAHLWAHGAAYDMTGGYVDQEDLERLLDNPTKTVAESCLVRQIKYWFEAGIDVDGNSRNAIPRRNEIIKSSPEVRAIAERYGICLKLIGVKS